MRGGAELERYADGPSFVCDSSIRVLSTPHLHSCRPLTSFSEFPAHPLLCPAFKISGLQEPPFPCSLSFR